MFYGNRSVILVPILAEEYSTGRTAEQGAEFARRPARAGGKGKIATMPYQGVIAGTSAERRPGKDGMVKFYTALSPNIGGLMTCGDSDRVVSGEFAFGLDCGDQERACASARVSRSASFILRKAPRSTRFRRASAHRRPSEYGAALYLLLAVSARTEAALGRMACDNYLRRARAWHP